MNEHDIDDTGLEDYDVAVVVFARVPGTDALDAAHRLDHAVSRWMHENPNLPVPHRGYAIVKDRFIKFARSIELGMALGNGYAWVQPTIKAGKEVGFGPIKRKGDKWSN